MHICNVKVGCGCFVICQLAQDICWLIGQKQFSDVHRPFLKNFKGWTDTASDGEFNQSLQFCRSGDANMNWDVNASSLDRIGPLNDWFCLESKLGSNSQFGVGSLRKFLLLLQCCIYILGRAIRVNVFVALWVASNVQTAESCFVKKTRFHQLHRAFKFAMRGCYASGEQ